MKLKKLLTEINFDKKDRGGLLPYYKINGKVYFALMIPSDSNYGGSKPQIAKGGIDPGETPIKTAIREAQEELGYKHKSSYKLKKIYVENNITWYCVQVDDMKLGPHTNETKKVVWLETKQAFKQIRTWQRPILRKAFEDSQMKKENKLNEFAGLKFGGHLYSKHIDKEYIGEDGILGRNDELLDWDKILKFLKIAKKNKWI